MAKVEEHSALRAVDVALNEIRVAHLKAGEAVAAKQRAQAEAAAAEKEREEALEDAARGKEGAEERAEDARLRRMQALQLAEAAQAADEAAQRVIRGERARLQQIRLTNWEEFKDDAEATVAEAQEAAEALLGPLRQYLAAWGKAAAKWNAIGPATQHQILEMDREAGRSRDISLIWEEASLPACPIDPSAVMAILNAMPRPKFLNSTGPTHEASTDAG